MDFPVDFRPPANAEVYVHDSVVDWVHNDLLYIYAKPGIEHTIEDAKKQSRFLKKLFEHQELNAILDIRKAPPLDIETRNFYGEEANFANLNSIAVIISSPFSRVIGNFYLGIFKKSLKTKLHTSVSDAEKWARKMFEGA